MSDYEPTSPGDPESGKTSGSTPAEDVSGAISPFASSTCVFFQIGQSLRPWPSKPPALGSDDRRRT